MHPFAGFGADTTGGGGRSSVQLMGCMDGRVGGGFALLESIGRCSAFVLAASGAIRADSAEWVSSDHPNCLGGGGAERVAPDSCNCLGLGGGLIRTNFGAGVIQTSGRAGRGFGIGVSSSMSMQFMRKRPALV